MTGSAMFVATWYKTLILLQQGSFQQMIKIVFRSNYKDKACFVLQKKISSALSILSEVLIKICFQHGNQDST